MGPGTDPEDGLDEGRADLGLRDEAHLAQQQLQVRSVNPKNLQRVDRSAIGVDSVEVGVWVRPVHPEAPDTCIYRDCIKAACWSGRSTPRIAAHAARF
jgi:hypothetical protein